MSAQLALALFVVAAGFATSAVISYGIAILKRQEGGYRISLDSVSSVFWSFTVCLFAGPFLTLETSLDFWRKGLLSAQMLSFAVLVTMIWSFCTGVFVIQLLVLAGMITV